MEIQYDDTESLFCDIDEIYSEEICRLDGVIEQTTKLQEDVEESLQTVKRLMGKDKTQNYLKTLAPISLWRKNEYLVWNIDAYINEHCVKTCESYEKQDISEKLENIKNDHCYSKSIQEKLFQQQVNKYLTAYNRMNTEKIKIRYALESALKINQRALRHCYVDSDDDDDDDIFSSPKNIANRKLKKAMSMSSSLFSSPRRKPAELISCKSNLRPDFSSFVGKSPGFGSPRSGYKNRRNTMTSSMVITSTCSSSPARCFSASTTKMMESVDFSTPDKVLTRSSYMGRTRLHSSQSPMKRFDSEFLHSNNKHISTKSLHKNRY